MRFHPTTGAYERATGQPWFTSGAVVGGELHLLPLAVRGAPWRRGAAIAALALALFAVPVTLLGSVSPFAIRLALADIGQAGTVAGRLYGDTGSSTPHVYAVGVEDGLVEGRPQPAYIEYLGVLDALLVLDDDTVVLPGHGEKTTIGFERRTNPFVADRVLARA